ncbi:unnamed protein product [Rhizophagus irregularis]|nr:unnamed protein product [Rhizophagus irregularis]
MSQNQHFHTTNTPGFICEEEGINSGVCFSSSAAINTIYRRVFGNKNKTKYPGATMLGFHDSYMIQQMLNDVDFRPFTICLYNITIFIASISDNNNYEGIFQNGEMVKQFQDITASSVWNQIQLLRNCDRIDLFGINHPLVQFKFKEQYKRLFSKTCTLDACTLDDWNNKRIMQYMF